jgi:hypothetical protein
MRLSLAALGRRGQNADALNNTNTSATPYEPESGRERRTPAVHFKEVMTVKRPKPAEVNAVHEDDALTLLGVSIDYHAGRLVCSVCGSQLKEAGLGAARRAAEGQYEFACDRLDCLEDFHAA